MRCAMCGSERLSPLGQLVSGERWGERLRLRFPRPGVLRMRPEFDADYARACRDCGAVLPFLGEQDRLRLDAMADGLSDIPS